MKKPDRGDMVPGLGGVRKARIANPGRSKGNVAATAICTCTWRRGSASTC
jgi:hypothetical protein